jgi:hypothetical protein
VNRKLRENYATIKDSGPSATSGALPVEAIRNTPTDAVSTPTRSSGPRTQPNSSLGATRIKRYTSPCKA